MSSPIHARPAPTEHAPYYAKYLEHVPETDVLAAMAGQLEDTLSLLRRIPEARAGEPHPPYTWSIKQVVGHVIDCERVFSYRALRFARGDATPLPGFDENAFANAVDCNVRTLADLTAEYEAVRRSSLFLFRSLDEAAWTRRGTASNAEVSVRALAYIVVGHERHHVAILRKRCERFVLRR